MKGVHMAKVKKKVRKLVRVSGWAIKHHDDLRPYVIQCGLWTIFDTGERAKAYGTGSYAGAEIIPVEIRELPAKKAGGGRKKNG